MIKPLLQFAGFGDGGVNLDRVKRARRRRGAKMVVLAADPGAPREPVGAEQDSRQRLERKFAAASPARSPAAIASSAGTRARLKSRGSARPDTSG